MKVRFGFMPQSTRTYKIFDLATAEYIYIYYEHLNYPSTPDPDKVTYFFYPYQLSEKIVNLLSMGYGPPSRFDVELWDDTCNTKLCSVSADKLVTSEMLTDAKPSVFAEYTSWQVQVNNKYAVQPINIQNA